MQRVPVALIGAGRLGAGHARTLISAVPQAELKVVTIPDNVPWTIAITDGSEHVSEQHRTWS